MAETVRYKSQMSSVPALIMVKGDAVGPPHLIVDLATGQLQTMRCLERRQRQGRNMPVEYISQVEARKHVE